MTNSKQKISIAEFFILLLIIGQMALYSLMWFRLLGDSSLKTMDFISQYGTGYLIRDGRYGQIYNAEAEAVIQRQVVGSTYDKPLIYNHPPHLTPLLALIASEDYVRAYIYWTISGLLVLALCVELIRRHLRRSGWSPLQAVIGALGCATFFPLFISLLIGQDTVYTLIGLLVWMFALLKGKEIQAGLGLMFAALSPTIAGALALPLLASRRRAGLWFIVSMLGLAIYSLLLVGFQGIADLISLLLTSSQGDYYGINWFAMYNLLGLLVRAFPNLSMDTVRVMVWGAAGLSILGMCIFWWNKKDGLTMKHIGIAVILGVFTAPHLHLHGLSFLLLPLLGIMSMLYQHGRTTLAVSLLPVLSSIFIVTMFLLPEWNYTAYYLLMAAMLAGFTMVKTPKEKA